MKIPENNTSELYAHSGADRLSSTPYETIYYLPNNFIVHSSVDIDVGSSNHMTTRSDQRSRAGKPYVPKSVSSTNLLWQQQIQKQWIGEITQIDEGSIWLEIADSNAPSLPVEEIELELHYFSESDQKDLAVGSVVYWTIGIEKAKSGAVKQFSELRLKRNIRWTEINTESIKNRAARFSELLREGFEK